MREYIGQQFIIGLSGEELTSEEAQFIVENNIGGVILFDRNLTSLEQTHKLITDIQKLRHKLPEKTPLFISVDMEGGRVHRLKEPFTQWPPVRNLGELDSSSLAFQFTHLMGQELKAVGFNLDYAPCVDIFMNSDNEVIGDRSLSADPEQVAKLSSAMVRGYVKAGVLSCAKHFPGHGYTSVDSHFDLPVDPRALKDLESQGDLEPFKKVIRARVDMIMTAHIQYPNIDPKYPATLSPLFVEQLLRQALRYRGLIISDDLDMKALTKNYPIEEIPVLALQAGINVLLYCNEPQSPPKAMKSIAKALSDGQLSEDQIRHNYEMIIKTKLKKLPNSAEPLSLDQVQALVGHPDHKAFAQAIREKQVDAYLNNE